MKTMRSAQIGLLLFLVTATGCIHTQLKHNTLQLAATAGELQYQQVVDNLAKFAANQDAVPSLVLLSGGSAQLSDSIRPAGTATDPPGVSITRLWTLGASRQWTQRWDFSPVINVGDLSQLREAFRDELEQQQVAAGKHWWTRRQEPATFYMRGSHEGTNVWVTDMDGFWEFAKRVFSAAGSTQKSLQLEHLFDRGKSTLIDP